MPTIDGQALPFEGLFVNYKKTDVAADMFQVIQPGETVTASVNAAKTYKLQGINQATATAVQGFKYAVGTEAPTSLLGLSFCESVASSPVDISPDQDVVAE